MVMGTNECFDFFGHSGMTFAAIPCKHSIFSHFWHFFVSVRFGPGEPMPQVTGCAV